LLLSGVTCTSIRHQAAPGKETAYAGLMERLARDSKATYRGLLESDGFVPFFRQATAIDVLERSGIGSRPTRRTGMASLQDLRAIPWVFSWSQARFFLPAWFGAGSALEKLAADAPQDFALLVKNIDAWPFVNYVMTNVESMLASADEELMHAYAALVQDAALRERQMAVIRAEFHRSRHWMERVFGSPMAARRPRLIRSIERRQQTLKSLHLHQIELLRHWRAALAAGDTAQSEALLRELLLAVNAIASGLRTTG
jgi:phosphoenolpyruvate carboxylase